MNFSAASRPSGSFNNSFEIRNTDLPIDNIMDGTEPTIHSEKTESPPSYTKLSFTCTRVVCVMQSQQDSQNQNISEIRFK